MTGHQAWGDELAPRRHRPALGIGLVTVLVPDYDEGLAFYVDAVGLTLLEDTPLSTTKRWVVVGGGSGAALLLARADGTRQHARIGDQAGGRVALFLYTDDLAADVSRMRAAGVGFEGPPREEPYGAVAVFADPWGNRWDLLQPAQPSGGSPIALG